MGEEGMDKSFYCEFGKVIREGNCDGTTTLECKHPATLAFVTLSWCKEFCNVRALEKDKSVPEESSQP